MNIKVVRLLVIVLFAASFGASAQTRPSRFVTTRGADFVAPDGKVLKLKGINLGTWLLPEGYMLGFEKASSPEKIRLMLDELVGESKARAFWKEFRDNYITRDDIRFIKRAGFNHVRVPFNYRLFVSRDDPNRLDGVGWELLARVVGWCRAEGLYVILDMHGAPGGQTGDNIDDSRGYPFLFESEEDQALTVKIWTKLAAQYANEPTIIGYDLLNEPIAHYFDVEALNPKLEPLYKRIVAAMRKYDRNHVMILGGAQWDNNFKVFGAPFDPKLAYTFHRYWMTVEPKAIEEYVAFRDRYKVPVWMSESGENTDEWIADFRTLLEKNDIGWSFWTYKRLDTTRSVVSIDKPEGWDAIVRFADSNRSTFEDVRKARPPKGVAERALRGYLDNLRYAKCRVNDGYLKALGLK